MKPVKTLGGSCGMKSALTSSSSSEVQASSKSRLCLFAASWDEDGVEDRDVVEPEGIL